MKVKKNKIKLETAVVKLPSDSHILCLERMAERLVLIIESDKIPEIVGDAIFYIAENAVLNAVETETRAEFIKSRFVRAMVNSNHQYVSAIMDSLSSVMEMCIDEDVYQPILDKSLGK